MKHTIKTTLAILLAITLLSTLVSALNIQRAPNPATDITENSAVITWTTDQPATSTVDFGTSKTLGLRIEDNNFNTQHRIQLTNLAPRTTYFFKIASSTVDETKTDDRNGALFQLTTTQPADRIPPRFSNIRPVTKFESTTVIGWITDEPATTTIFFGETEPTRQLQDNQLATDHSIEIPTTTGQTFTYIVSSCDASNNCANSTTQGFLAGQAQEQPPLTVTIPALSNDNLVTVNGTTRPFASVAGFVGNDRQQSTTADTTGTFVLRDLRIITDQADISIEAQDEGGTTRTSKTVRIDKTPPTLTITKPDIVTTNENLVLQGTINKPAHLDIRHTINKAPLPPAPVEGLRIDRTDDNTVELSWQASTEEDLAEYLIIRNGARIATTTSTNFADKTAPARTNTYRIIAVDTGCNQAQPSIAVDTQVTGSEVQEPEQAVLECEKPTTTLDTNAGPFSIPITLEEGTNTITITATDEAGHQASQQATVILDSEAPTILLDNIEELTPSYIPEVTIKGQASEQVTIAVYLNGASEPESFVVSEPDGTFEIPTVLQRGTRITKTETQTELDIGEGFENTIVLEATDQAGRKTQTEPRKVIFALCGFGSNFDIKLGKPLPNILTPRLIIEQLQEIGLTVNATYKGRHEVEFLGRPRAQLINPAPAFEKLFDNDLVIPDLIPSITAPGKFIGYLRLKFNNLPEEVPTSKEATLFDKEDAISKHRTGKPIAKAGLQKTAGVPAPFAQQQEGCLAPGLGCMKFLVELEIEYQEKIKKGVRRDPRTDKITEDFTLSQPRRERRCIPIEIAIDKRPDPADIPSGFLKAAIRVLDDIIDVFDTILKPLTIIGQYTVYTCLGSNAILFPTIIYETYHCEGVQFFSEASAFFGELTGTASTESTEPKFDPKIARAGLCDEIYDKTKQAQEYNLCTTCQQATEHSKYVQYELVQPVCDRVACPSAPTLQTHIRDRTYEDPPEPLPIRQEIITKTTDDLTKWQVNGQIWKGSDCAFTELPEGTKPAAPSALGGMIAASTKKPFGPSQGKITLNYEGIKTIYENTKKLESQQEIKGIKLEDCQDHARPAHPTCCGIEYKREWATACGYSLPIAGNVYESFDELKESTCEAAQAANQKTAELDCGGIFNSVAGFCEPNTGEPVIDPIRTGIKYTTQPAGARTDEAYIIIVPATETYTKKGLGTTAANQPRHNVYRGYITETFTRTQTTIIPKENEIALDVNAKTQVIAQKHVDLTPHFIIETQEGEHAATETTERNTAKQNFISQFCNGLEPDCTIRAGDIYEQIRNQIEYTGKTYIVKPDQEGLLRSFQCACLPALTAHIQQMRDIFAVTRQCMQSILLTGDGSEGVCQARLSTYICDLIYDVVKCFMQKWSTPGGGARAKAGITNLFSVLTNSGTTMQQRIQGRYGQTAMWKTMFTDKKLVHSICAFAFTGSFNFDVTNLFNQQVETIPIESQAFFPKCTRRFVSFDPTSNPRGKTTWTYDFALGLAAGSDVRFDLELKCSKGLRCDPSDGYRNGECDCAKISEQRIPLTPQCTPPLPTGNIIKRSDILNTQCFTTIEAADPDGNVRYDQAILHWEYEDPKTGSTKTDNVPCNIDLVGDDAPAECGFDSFSGSFRCSFGIGQSAIKLNNANPKYKKQTPEGTPTFGIDDEMNFELDITQFIPEDRQNQDKHKKYLLYKIEDNGRIVKEQTERDVIAFNDFTLATSGDYKKTIKITTLTNDNFKTATTIPRQRIINPTTRQIETATLFKTFTTTDIPQNYLFIFKPNNILEIYRGHETGSSLEKTTDKPLATISQVTQTTTSAQYFTDNKPHTLHFEFSKEIPKPAPDTEIQILVTPSKGANPCDTKEPTTWTIHFRAVDADRNGRPTSQTSIDPSTGKQAEKDVPFTVICKNPAELTQITTGQTAPTPTPAATPTPPPAAQTGTIDLQHATLKITEKGNIVSPDKLITNTFYSITLTPKESRIAAFAKVSSLPLGLDYTLKRSIDYPRTFETTLSGKTIMKITLFDIENKQLSEPIEIPITITERAT